MQKNSSSIASVYNADERTTLASRIRNLKQATEHLHYRFLYPDSECLHILYLREDGHVIDSSIEHGGNDHVMINLRALFWRAMENDAASLIIAHNHPSGIAAPSAADQAITRQLACVGKSLGVDLMDHLIFAGGDWFSFRQSGLL